MNNLIPNIKKNLNFILPITSGLLLILFPLFDFNHLIWFSLIPLFLFIFSKSTTTKRAFFGGLVTGTIFGGGLLLWLFDTVPFEFLDVNTEKEVVVVFFVFLLLWLIHILFVGLFIGAFSWTIKKLLSLKINTIWPIFLIPGIWIIFEYLRTWGFNILWLGKETLWSPYWTWGNLAYFLHNNSPLSQIADIGGIYLISFLIVLINTLLFLMIYKIKQKTISLKYFASIIIFIISIFSIWKCYGFYKLNIPENGKIIKLAILQTNFASGNELNAYNRLDIFNIVKKIFQEPENINQNPDIIIEPEGFSITAMAGSNEIAKYILKDFWRPGQIFIENQKFTDKNGKTTSRLFYFDLDKKEPIAVYDKTFLMPNGDYLPYITKLFLNLYSFKTDLKEKFFSRGNFSYPAKTLKGNVGGTICTGFMSPNENRRMTNNGAEILMSSSSDAPFHGSATLLNQIMAMTKFRAIENNRYFAQATNVGYSFLLNSKGEVIDKSPTIDNRIIFVDAKLLTDKSLYTKYGDWIIYLTILILTIFLFLKFYKK
ncbi:MAG: apolipoprotein N-acyltransferase [Patescibacteria group bacterium]